MIIDIGNAAPVYYFSRGSIHDQAERFTEAETDYLKALEIDPYYFDVLYNLGALYFNNGADIINEATENYGQF